jgi:hypothetical protein
MSKREIAKRSNSKEKGQNTGQEKVKKQQTVLDHLRDVSDRIKDQITIIAVERGFEIIIQVAALYGAGEIVKLLVSKDFQVSQLIVLLKAFLDKHGQTGIHFIQVSTKMLLNAGMMLKDIVRDGIIDLKILTTNTF